MRGLTDEERAVVGGCEGPLPHRVVERMLRRGLLEERPCPACGSFDCENGYVRTTAEGQLALRLDAAAKWRPGR
jgi:hypothetical protein